MDAADASQKLACVALHARFLKKDGTHSCQLIISRSKLITDGLSKPRAEFFAPTMNADTGEIVWRALQENQKGKMKLTDSGLVIHWRDSLAQQSWKSSKAMGDEQSNWNIQIYRFIISDSSY